MYVVSCKPQNNHTHTKKTFNRDTKYKDKGIKPCNNNNKKVGYKKRPQERKRGKRNYKTVLNN